LNISSISCVVFFFCKYTTYILNPPQLILRCPIEEIRNKWPNNNHQTTTKHCTMVFPNNRNNTLVSSFDGFNCDAQNSSNDRVEIFILLKNYNYTRKLVRYLKNTSSALTWSRLLKKQIFKIGFCIKLSRGMRSRSFCRVYREIIVTSSIQSVQQIYGTHFFGKFVWHLDIWLIRINVEI
jgi:hypothetical protein